MNTVKVTRERKVAALAAVVALALSACGSTAGAGEGGEKKPIPDGPIILAGTLPLSGTMGAYGTAQAAAYEAAVTYVNEELDGIAGHKIELRMENDQSDPATGVAIAQGFVEDEVSAIISPSYSPMQEQVLPIYQRAGLVVSTANAAPGEFNDLDNYTRIFAHYPGFDDFYTSMPAFLAASDVEKLGILTDTSPAVEETLERLTKSLEAEGIEVVSLQQVPFGSTEFATPLRQLRDDGAESVFALTTVGLAQLYDALRGLKWTPKTINTTNGTPWADGLDSVDEYAGVIYGDCAYGITPGEELDPTIQELMEYFVDEIGSSYPGQVAGVLPALNSVLTYKYAVEEADTLHADTVAATIETFQDKEYLTPANMVSFSDKQHIGVTHTATCSILPLGEAQTPYVATSTSDRQPLPK